MLNAVHGMNHTSGSQEETPFEKGVRHQVENGHEKSAHATGQKHVTELGDGGVGKNFFDVVLRNGDCCGHDRR